MEVWAEGEKDEKFLSDKYKFDFKMSMLGII